MFDAEEARARRDACVAITEEDDRYITERITQACETGHSCCDLYLRDLSRPANVYANYLERLGYSVVPVSSLRVLQVVWT